MKPRPKKPRMLPYDEQAFFCRQMAFVVRAGVPLAQARELLADGARTEGVPDIFGPVFDLVDTGETFAGALRQSGLFSDYLVSVVELGESTGNLDRALGELADYFDSVADIRRQLRSAFTYPLILFVMMLAVILFLIVEMLPQFSSILTGAGGQMPAFAGGLLEFGRFLRRDWLLLLALLAAAAVGVHRLVHSRAGRELAGRFLLHSRAFGEPTRLLATARFCSAMRMALSCGNGFSESVRLAAGIAENSAVRERLLALGGCAESDNIPEAVAKAGIFPEPFVRLFGTAYRTGNLEETMEKMAAYYTGGFDDAVSAMTSRIEPALVIGLSCVAGVLLFSVMMPIIRIMQAIS